MTENAKMRQNAFFEMAPKARTLLHTYFLIISLHSVCQETIFFCRKQRGNEWGGYFRLFPPLGPRQFDWTKLAYFTSRSCIQQNKTSIKPLRHTLRKCVWTWSSCGAPGVRTGPKLHMHN